MFNMGGHGTRFERKIVDYLTAMSLVGGFFTSMYFMTRTAYQFFAGPFIDLKLAAAFDRIVYQDSGNSKISKSINQQFST